MMTIKKGNFLVKKNAKLFYDRARVKDPFAHFNNTLESGIHLEKIIKSHQDISPGNTAFFPLLTQCCLKYILIVITKAGACR